MNSFVFCGLPKSGLVQSNGSFLIRRTRLTNFQKVLPIRLIQGKKESFAGSIRGNPGSLMTLRCCIPSYLVKVYEWGSDEREPSSAADQEVNRPGNPLVPALPKSPLFPGIVELKSNAVFEVWKRILGDEFGFEVLPFQGVQRIQGRQSPHRYLPEDKDPSLIGKVGSGYRHGRHCR